MIIFTQNTKSELTLKDHNNNTLIKPILFDSSIGFLKLVYIPFKVDTYTLFFDKH